MGRHSYWLVFILTILVVLNASAFQVSQSVDLNDDDYDGMIDPWDFNYDPQTRTVIYSEQDIRSLLKGKCVKSLPGLCRNTCQKCLSELNKNCNEDQSQHDYANPYPVADPGADPADCIPWKQDNRDVLFKHLVRNIAKGFEDVTTDKLVISLSMFQKQKLQDYVTSQRTVVGLDIGDMLASSLSPYEVPNYGPYQSWTERLFGISTLQAIICVVVVFLSTTLMWLGLTNRISMFRLIMVLIGVTLIISFFLNYVNLYQIKMAEKLANTQIDGCILASDTTVFSPIKTLFQNWGEDKCAKYLKEFHTDVMFEISPIEAIVQTFSVAIEKLSEGFGKGFGGFFTQFYMKTPWSLMLPSMLTLLCLVAVVLGVYLYCGSRRVEYVPRDRLPPDQYYNTDRRIEELRHQRLLGEERNARRIDELEHNSIVRHRRPHYTDSDEHYHGMDGRAFAINDFSEGTLDRQRELRQKSDTFQRQDYDAAPRRTVDHGSQGDRSVKYVRDMDATNSTSDLLSDRAEGYSNGGSRNDNMSNKILTVKDKHKVSEYKELKQCGENKVVDGGNNRVIVDSEKRNFTADVPSRGISQAASSSMTGGTIESNYSLKDQHKVGDDKELKQCGESEVVEGGYEKGIMEGGQCDFRAEVPSRDLSKAASSSMPGGTIEDSSSIKDKHKVGDDKEMKQRDENEVVECGDEKGVMESGKSDFTADVPSRAVSHAAIFSVPVGKIEGNYSVKDKHKECDNKELNQQCENKVVEGGNEKGIMEGGKCDFIADVPSRDVSQAASSSMLLGMIEDNYSMKDKQYKVGEKELKHGENKVVEGSDEKDVMSGGMIDGNYFSEIDTIGKDDLIKVTETRCQTILPKADEVKYENDFEIIEQWK